MGRRKEEAVRRILAGYNEDLNVYREILAETEKIAIRFEQSEDRARLDFEAANVTEAEPGDSSAEVSGEVPAEVPGAAPGEAGPEDLPPAAGIVDDELAAFAEWRGQKVNEVDKRRETIEKLKADICQELKEEAFGRDLVGRIAPRLLGEWDEVSGTLKQITTKVLELDEKIFRQLKMELEFLKLEVHRMNSLTKSRRAYNKLKTADPRFIDKSQ